MAPRLLALFICLASCSDPADDPGGGSAGSDTGASGGSASGGSASGGSTSGGSASGGSTSGGSASGGSASGGSASGGSASGGNSGTLTAEDLFPVGIGSKWTYSVTATASTCEAGSGVTTVLGAGPQQGRDAYEMQDFCFGESVYLAFEAGELYQLVDGQWNKSMALPIQEGTKWIYSGEASLTWHAEASVTVPAGTFTGCFRRDAKAPNSATFCPGVGLVRRVGDGYTGELSAYELH